jgi:type I restriction enzyme, R subunit
MENRQGGGMKTDTTEKGLESLIVQSLVSEAGYIQGDPQDYDREHAIDLAKLLRFLAATQSDNYEALGIDEEGPKRTQFLHRLQGEIAKRGVVDVLRHGIKHGPAHVDLFYGTPTPGNVKAAERFAANIFSVTRQLRYRRSETALSLDMACSSTACPSPPSNSKTSSPSRRFSMPCSSTSATATRRSCCSSSAAAFSTLPWTITRCVSAPT